MRIAIYNGAPQFQHEKSCPQLGFEIHADTVVEVLGDYDDPKFKDYLKRDFRFNVKCFYCNGAMDPQYGGIAYREELKEINPHEAIALELGIKQ